MVATELGLVDSKYSVSDIIKGVEEEDIVLLFVAQEWSSLSTCLVIAGTR